jgi:hypothetical protein
MCTRNNSIRPGGLWSGIPSQSPKFIHFRRRETNQAPLDSESDVVLGNPLTSWRPRTQHAVFITQDMTMTYMYGLLWCHLDVTTKSVPSSVSDLRHQIRYNSHQSHFFWASHMASHIMRQPTERSSQLRKIKSIGSLHVAHSGRASHTGGQRIT